MIASELWDLLVKHEQKIPAKISELKDAEPITPKLLKTLGFDKHESDGLLAMAFLETPGIGPALATRLYAEGYRDIAKVPTDELPLQSQAFLKHKPLTSIPRELMTELISGLPKADYVVAGSYRRGKPASGDIDIVYFGKNLQEFLAALKLDIYSNGPHKVSGIYKLPDKPAVSVDIWITEPTTLDSMLLYATGSKRYNVIMRMVAKRKGLKLNQYGVFKDTERLPTKSEEDIFEALGLKYKIPEERK